MSSELNIKQVKNDSLLVSILSFSYLVLSITTLVQLVINGFEETTNLSVMIVAYLIVISLIVVFGCVAYLSIRRYMSPKLLRDKAIKNRDERLKLIRDKSNTVTLGVMAIIITSVFLISVLMSNALVAGTSLISMILLITVKCITEVYYKRKF